MDTMEINSETKEARENQTICISGELYRAYNMHVEVVQERYNLQTSNLEIATGHA